MDCESLRTHHEVDHENHSESDCKSALIDKEMKRNSLTTTRAATPQSQVTDDWEIFVPRQHVSAPVTMRSRSDNAPTCRHTIRDDGKETGHGSAESKRKRQVEKVSPGQVVEEWLLIWRHFFNQKWDGSIQVRTRAGPSPSLQSPFVTLRRHQHHRVEAFRTSVRPDPGWCGNGERV